MPKSWRFEEGRIGSVHPGNRQLDVADAEIRHPAKGNGSRSIAGTEDAEELGEGDADGSDEAGLDDEKQGPAVEKSPERGLGFAQKDVLPAGVRHHGGELGVAQTRR